jgi:hypothetical protein
LALLDNSIACPTSDKSQRLTIESLADGYSMLIHNFNKIGHLDNIIFVYSLALAKIVKKKLKRTFQFNRGEFLVVYAGVLYLSIKFANDIEEWYLEDFADATGLEKEFIQQMEMFVLKDVLNFKVLVPQESLDQELTGFSNLSMI